tara:strand:+ start:506 stop:829 length:324 start_codon:yes stop_codon:yes gene_type:complete
MECIAHEKISVEDIKVGKWYNFYYEYDNPVYVTGLKRTSCWHEIGGHDGVPETIIEGNVMFTVYVHNGASNPSLDVNGDYNYYRNDTEKYFDTFEQGTEVDEWVMAG